MRGNPPAFLFSLEKEAQAYWKETFLLKKKSLQKKTELIK